MKRLIWLMYRDLDLSTDVLIEAESRFEDLGLDSLDMAILWTSCEGEFGVCLSNGDLAGAETVSSLWWLIEEAGPVVV